MSTKTCKKVDINGQTYIREDLTFHLEKEGNPYAIVRGYRSGVICGYARHIGRGCVEVHEARQMFRWNSTFVLIDMAVTGINKKEKCRFSQKSKLPITVTDACAILPCTQQAAKSLMEHEAESHD